MPVAKINDIEFAAHIAATLGLQQKDLPKDWVDVVRTIRKAYGRGGTARAMAQMFRSKIKKENIQ